MSQNLHLYLSTYHDGGHEETSWDGKPCSDGHENKVADKVESQRADGEVLDKGSTLDHSATITERIGKKGLREDKLSYNKKANETVWKSPLSPNAEKLDDGVMC